MPGLIGGLGPQPLPEKVPPPHLIFAMNGCAISKVGLLYSHGN